MSIKIKELPETERPYEKLELYGEKKLSNAELLAIIIKTGTREETSVQLAQRILKLNKTQKEDLSFLQDISIEELMQIKGIGKVKAIQIKAASELAVRIFQASDYRKTAIKQPHDVARLLMSELKSEKKEKVKVVILNSKSEILKIQEVSSGGVNFVDVTVRDIMSEPIKMKAPKIIIVHNHPSGDSTPSEADVNYTEKLYDISLFMGIELVDHLVIGNMNYTSIIEIMLAKETKEDKQKGAEKGK